MGYSLCCRRGGDEEQQPPWKEMMKERDVVNVNGEDEPICNGG